jgi:hypothetical protein
MTRFTLFRLAALGFVLAALSLPPLSGAHAAQPAWLQATRTAHGVRLTLSIRNRPYPQNVLVRVWARLENVSGHDIGLYDNGPQAAGKYIPQPVVRSASGGASLPISLTDYLPYPGPAPHVDLLSTGAVRDIPELVILRGPRVQLRLTVARPSTGFPRHTRTLATPYVHVTLTAADPPQVDLVMLRATASVRLTPPSGAHGNPLAVWYAVCEDANSDQNIDWTPVSAVITPTCSPLTGWHEIVGWLGHSVAQIDWGAQQE